MTTIPYAIRRTEREKTVALTIEGRGKLVVTAPEGVPIDRLNSIVRAQGAMGHQTHPPGKRPARTAVGAGVRRRERRCATSAASTG